MFGNSYVTVHFIGKLHFKHTDISESIKVVFDVTAARFCTSPHA